MNKQKLIFTVLCSIKIHKHQLKKIHLTQLTKIHKLQLIQNKVIDKQHSRISEIIILWI